MWDANMYGMFEKERMQPSIDLVGRIDDKEYGKILDVGCGSGMSTLPLRKRFPKSEIIGVDISENMLDKAEKLISDVEWIKRDCSRPLNDLGSFDLVFSNAFLQWIPSQEDVIKNISDLLNDNGVFAIQIPNFEEMPVSRFIKETANEFDKDNLLFCNIEESTCFNYSLAEYYDMFSRYFSNIEIWQTNYFHQMEESYKIIEFVRSTALLPYLDCLNETQASSFIDMIYKKVDKFYKKSEDGAVLFEFKRIFVMAKK